MAKKPKYFTISDEQADKLRTKKVTAPKSYNPGKGRPKEHLAYLNKGEMKALRGMNGNNMERGPKGLPSFPPADAIGSSSKASGTTTGKTTTKSSGPGGGMMGGSGSGGSSRTAPSVGGGKPSGGGGGGGSNRPSGGMMGGTGSGGSSRTAPSSSKPSGGGPKGDVGGSGKGAGPRSGLGTTKSPDTGKAAPGFTRSAPAGNQFGPRAVDRTAGAVTPSSLAAQNTLDRIAAGSAITGGYTGKMQDQVPKDLSYRSTPSQVVNLRQDPTVGANSPFADPGVTEYNRNTYNQPNAMRMAEQYAQYRSPPAPTTEAYKQALGRIAAAADPTGIAMPSGRAFPVTQQAVPQNLAATKPTYLDAGARYPAVSASAYADPDVGVPTMATRAGLAGVNYGTLNTPEEVAQSRAAAASWQSQFSPSQVASPARLPTTVTPYGPTVASTADPYGQRYAQTAAALNSAPIVRVDPNAVATEAALGKTRGITAADLAGAPATVSVPRYGFTNPYAGNQNVSPVNTTETPAEQTVREAPVQDMGQYSPTVQKVMEPIASWAADKLNTRVAPSQQDSWLGRVDQALSNQFGTPGPDSAYARAMANAANRGDNGRPAYSAPSTEAYVPPAATPVSPTAAAPALAPLPPYVNYQQLPPDYSAGYTGGVAPSPLVSQYLANGYADGGAVDDGFSFADQINYGMKNAPSKNPFFQLAYAIGLPVFHRGTGDNGWSQVTQDMRMDQLKMGVAPSSKPAAAAPKAEDTYKPVQQLSQYVMPQPDQRISDFNNSGLLQQQNQLFRVPEKRGGSVGDGIDAAIRLAKSFA